jgi:dipeptidase E
VFPSDEGEFAENETAMCLFLSSWRIDETVKELVELVGAGARTAMVLNALDHLPDRPRDKHLEEERLVLHALGLPASELDRRLYIDRHPALRGALAQADLLWVTGGNAFVLREAVRCSGLEGLLPEHLHQDALAYGGYSAGACIAGPTLQGLELVDELKAVNKPIWEGLGLVDFAIVPHYRSTHPESGSIEEVVNYLKLRGIPYRVLRDGQALIHSDGVSRLVEWPAAK